MQKICPFLFLLFLILIAIPRFVLAQVNKTDTLPQFKAVIAGKEYKASFFKKWLWGSNYRNVWTTPVKIRLLNLDTADNGLKPSQINKHDPAKTLYLTNPEGQEYTLRSVNKWPGKLVSQGFRRTFVEDRINDEVSTSNPYSPATLPYLEEQLNI